MGQWLEVGRDIKTLIYDLYALNYTPTSIACVSARMCVCVRACVCACVYLLMFIHRTQTTNIPSATGIHPIVTSTKNNLESSGIISLQ